MTEVTLLDAVTWGFFILTGAGLWYLLLERLYREGLRSNRRSQCPPHDWIEVYRDGETMGEYIFDGLKCIKCSQRPGGLRNGESWNFPPLTPP